MDSPLKSFGCVIVVVTPEGPGRSSISLSSLLSVNSRRCAISPAGGDRETVSIADWRKANLKAIKVEQVL